MIGGNDPNDKKEYAKFYDELTKKAQNIINDFKFTAFQKDYKEGDTIYNFLKPFYYKILIGGLNFDTTEYTTFITKLPAKLSNKLKTGYTNFDNTITNIYNVSKKIFATYDNCNNIINSLYDSLDKIINLYETFNYREGNKEFETEEKKLLNEYNSIFDNKDTNKNLETELKKLETLKGEYNTIVENNGTIITNSETNLKTLENYIELFNTIRNNLDIIAHAKDNVLLKFKKTLHKNYNNKK